MDNAVPPASCFSWRRSRSPPQWHADRRAAILKATGINVASAETSHHQMLEAADWELHHTEKAAGDKIRATRSAAEAGFAGSLYYERPRGAESEARRRGGIAERMKITISKTPGGDVADQMVALPAR
jgi:hypothetical protein